MKSLPTKHVFKSPKIRIASLLLLLALLAIASVIFLPKLASHSNSRNIQSGDTQELNQLVPDGVLIQSRTDKLSIKFDASSSSGKNQVEFHVVLPPSISLSPIISDYALLASDNVTTKSIQKNDESNVKGLSEAVKGSSAIAVKDEGILRFCRLVKITITPSRISLPPFPACRVERLELEFPFPKPIAAPAPLPEMLRKQQGFLRIFHHLVANPEAVPLYSDRSTPATHTAPGMAKPWKPQQQIPGKWLKVLINKSGLYKITPSLLHAADPKINAPLSAIRIFSRGKEVPTLRLTPEDNLSTSSMIVFYANASDSKYSAERAYWVSVPDADKGAPSAPAKIQTQTSPPISSIAETPVIAVEHEFVFEEDESLQIQKGNFLSIKSSKWVWSELNGQSPSGFRFDLKYLDTESSAPAKLEIRLHRGADADAKQARDVLVSLNGQSIGKITSASLNAASFFQIPPGVIRESGNTLSFQLAESLPDGETLSATFLDSFRIHSSRYLVAEKDQLEIKNPTLRTAYKMTGFRGKTPLLFNISNPEQPILLPIEPALSDTWVSFVDPANANLLASSVDAIPEAPKIRIQPKVDLVASSNEADYLIIYNRMFQKEIQPLIQHQENKGLKVRAIDVEAIYQAYSHGELSPLAIKDFLVDSLRRWKRPPTYVCLFGDANSDYRNELHTDVQNLVPAFSNNAASGDTWASELWYATLLGQDLLPDILLGRISVQNIEDAEEVVRKIIDYSKAAPLGPWRARMGYCADFGMFGPAVERIHRDYQPQAYGSTQIFVDDMIWEDEFYLPRHVVKENNIKVSTPTTLRLLDTFDQGTALFLFFGHGSPNIWTDQRIWFGGDDERSDNLNLRNEGRLPFVSTYTCNQGAFDYPMPPWDINISEDMMRVKNRGSIAMYVPSGPGDTPNHEQMARGLMESIFRKKMRRLGEITAFSQIYYGLRGSAPHILQMYLLLGDPALDLAIPTEMNEGRVTPDSLNSIDLPLRSTCIFSGETKNMMRGSFVASLYDPQDRFVMQSERKSFYLGKIRWKFDLPKNPQTGRWTVRVYYGNDRTREDGIIFGTVNVARPVVKVQSIKWKIPAKNIGDLATGEFEISNDSEILAAEIPAEVIHILPDGKKKTIFKQVQNLLPQESKAVNFTWKAQPGMHVFIARITRYLLPAEDSQPAQDQKSMAAYIPTGSLPAVVAAGQIAQTAWQSFAPTINFSTSVPIFYSGLQSPKDVLFHLQTQDGVILSTETLRISPSASGETGETSVTFRVSNLASLTTEPLSFKVMTDAVGRIQQIGRINIENPALPDLEIAPGSIRFTPAHPTEGDTILARFLVRNKGQALSEPFRIQVSQLSPGKPDETLKSRGSDAKLLEPLAPGRNRSVQTRWDYDAYREYAGSYLIRIKVMPDADANMQRELSIENNYVDIPLRILKRAEVEVDVLSKSIRAISDGKDPNKKECRVRVRIKNTGEAAASDHMLGFYNKIPLTRDDYLSSDFLQYQQELPRLKGNQEKIFSYKWVIRSSDPDTSPTAKVYRITKSIRGKDIDLKGYAKEW